MTENPVDSREGPMINLNPFWMILYQQIAGLMIEEPSSVTTTTDKAPTALPVSSRQLEEVLARLDKMVMLTHAMWTLVAERTGIGEDELARRVTELDARDGTMDGRVTPKPVKCSCGATVCQKFGRCLFCGKAYPGASAFGI